MFFYFFVRAVLFLIVFFATIRLPADTIRLSADSLIVITSRSILIVDSLYFSEAFILFLHYESEKALYLDNAI